ncbi:hypothetical protein [Phormidesmis priestleyi]
MTPKEELIQAIQRSSDEIVLELLEVLQTLQHPPLAETVDTQPADPRTVLERMGGVPKHLLSVGYLSDRDSRRPVIADRLRQKYRHES